MNLQEYTVACMQEEASEVIQAAGKALRFKLEDVNPVTGATNASQIVFELNDLFATIQLMCEAGVNLKGLYDEEAIAKARDRKIDYMGYSLARGALVLDAGELLPKTRRKKIMEITCKSPHCECDEMLRMHCDARLINSALGQPKVEWLLAEIPAALDLHKVKAAEVFGVALADVTDEQRRAGKAINFAAIYP
jgi:hypothetical protein